MADFRKWLFALAVVALLAGFTIPASAQIPTTPICSSQVATNYLARSEGYTEQVGDLIVTCTGGIPTAAGIPVPQADITVTMSQNVTSRITAATSSGTFLDALLIIDEPNSALNPTIQILNCGAPGAPENAALGSSGPGVCEIISAGPTSGNSSPSTYNGTPQTNTSTLCTAGTPAVSLLGTAAAAGCTGHPNVFQGRQGQAANIVVFHGVPLDPPGTTTRILRFTNIRVNANGAGIAQANQTSLITMSIASAGNSTLQIAVQAQAVATVQPSLSFAAIFKNTSFAQCISQAKGLLTASPEPIFGTTSSCGSSSCNGSANSIFASSGYGTPTVRFSELFASAWKVKNVAYTVGALGGNGTYTAGLGGQNPYIYPSSSPDNPAGVAVPDANQNVPGVSYFTESGFEFQSVLQNPATNPPAGFGTGLFGIGGTTVTGDANPFADTSTGINAAGTANAGTRLATSLQNIPNGLSLYVSPIIFLYRQGTSYSTSGGPNTNSGGGATGVMVLTNTASDGSGSYNPPSGPITVANQPLQLVSVSNGAALIVYEILFTDPFSLEYADVPIVVSYATQLNANAPIGLPQPNVIATAAGGYAPFYSTSAATQASGTLPIPRFVFNGSALNLFGIVKCNCNLLFPYVTQAPGYDTGIAVANTTMDPYGTTNQFGAVQMWYYGSLANGGAAPGTQCTNTASPGTCPGTQTVSAGQVLTYTLFNGSAQWGLDNRGAGFTGYMIVQAQFQYCHAFAFIGGLGGGPAVNAQTNGLSEGYLALVLDPNTLSRGLVQGESLGQ